MAVGDAVQIRMHAHSGAQRAGDVLASGTRDNLLYGEILAIRVLAVEQGGRDPDFVGQLENDLARGVSKSGVHIYIFTGKSSKCQQGAPIITHCQDSTSTRWPAAARHAIIGVPMKARVFVTPKSTVLDPQGQTVRSALNGLGFAAIAEVRQGKFFEIALASGTTRQQAQTDIETIAHEVLANPVIEEYRVEILD